MIEWVYDQCLEGSSSKEFLPQIEIAVVTDHPDISSTLEKGERNVVRVDDDVSTGSERIYLAWERYYSKENYDFIINVQGDEPLVSRDDLVELLKFHVQSDFNITTFVRHSLDEKNYKNPNCVKAVMSEESGKCHYFSRSPIPFYRDEFKGFYHHIGIYCYQVEALKKFFSGKKSKLEECESLEQLRALDLGMSIGAIVTEKTFIGVDTPEDIKKCEGVLSEREKSK